MTLRALELSRCCGSAGSSGHEHRRQADPFILHLYAALAEKERALVSDRTKAGYQGGETPWDATRYGRQVSACDTADPPAAHARRAGVPRPPRGTDRLSQLARTRVGAAAEEGGRRRHVPHAPALLRIRHFYVTALVQSGVNAKVAQTLAGHHSASFTLDQYADAVSGSSRRRARRWRACSARQVVAK